MSSSNSSSSSSSMFSGRNLALFGAAGATIAAAALAYRSYKAKPSCCSSSAKASSAPQSSLDLIPIINLGSFLNRSGSSAASGTSQWQHDCKQIASLLREYGILIIQDPRVPDSENEEFLNLMEQYYEQPEEVRNIDVRKELYYQIGVTPKGIEHARDHCERIGKLEADQKPLTKCPPEKDPKSRFFWRMGEAPEKTDFPVLNAAPVIPKAFPQWTDRMNRWGNLMLQAVSTVAEMSAVGFDLPVDTFTNFMKNAPHLLAPTASDLKNDGALGTVFANYHYDLSFLTIHGRSRFPGLYIWTRQGKKIQVKVPPNCLLIQAGMQFEWLTGGEVLAGFHEVVVVDDTLKAVEKAKAEKRSLWRISSTLFGHIASDVQLEPLPKFATAEAKQKYPSMKTGTYVQKELEMIRLAE